MWHPSGSTDTKSLPVFAVNFSFGSKSELHIKRREVVSKGKCTKIQCKQNVLTAIGGCLIYYFNRFRDAGGHMVVRDHSDRDGADGASQPRDVPHASFAQDTEV